MRLLIFMHVVNFMCCQVLDGANILLVLCNFGYVMVLLLLALYLEGRALRLVCPPDLSLVHFGTFFSIYFMFTLLLYGSELGRFMYKLNI